MKGKKSFINKAMKEKDPADFDLDEKARMMRILNHYFKLRPLVDEVLFFDKDTGKLEPEQPVMTKEGILKYYFVCRPDLLIKNFEDHPIAVEIDGDVHWQNSKAVRRTNERNEHYETGNVKLLWFTRDEVLKDSTATLVSKISGMLKMEPIVI